MEPLRLFRSIVLWMRSLFRPSRVEQDLHDEIADHLERQIEAGLAQGLARDEARRAALLTFGGVDQHKEECRDRRRPRVLDHALRDVRFALRYFARTPVTSATMILILALGLGFNSALFLLTRSFVSGPVPGVAKAESLVRIRGIDRTMPGRAIGREFSYPEYRAYADQHALFSDVAAWTSTDAVLGVGPRHQDLHSGAVTYVTANYFRVLGLEPRPGQGLPADASDVDPSPPMVGVISHLVWERHFDRSADAIGRTITVNGFQVTVVGVAPRRFAGARTGGSQMRVWMPLSTRPLLQRTDRDLESYDAAPFGLVARLQTGIRPEDANATVQTIAARAARQATSGPSPAAAAADVVPLLGGNYFPPSGENEERGSGAFLAAVFPLLIQLIPYTTVSALLTGLAVARRREIAVRMALGASRARVVRQLVTESVLLAVVAGGVGLTVIGMLLRVFDASIPDLAIEIDWRGLAFTFGLALGVGVLFGLSPALHATRLALSEALKDSAAVVAGRRLQLQSWLVVAQIALTQPALLGTAALFLEMRSDLEAMPAQVFAERTIDVRFNTNPRYGALDEQREMTLARLRLRLANLPGVAAVVPQDIHGDSFDIDLHPGDRTGGAEIESLADVGAVAAPDGYFPLMSLSFVRGRDFEAAERGRDGAIIVNTDLARRLWGTADPIGRRVTARVNRGGMSTFTIVGVVDDAMATPTARTDERRAAPRVFVPTVRTTSHFLIRTRGPAEPLLPAIRAAAAAEAPSMPFVSASTVAAIEAAERRSIRRNISIAGALCGLALLLSAIGLYAVVAFAVRQRVREIGIHTALGASSRQVVGRFIRIGLRLALAGLVVGIGISIAGGRDGRTPPSGVGVLAVLAALAVIGVALLASWIPARRAARVNPVEALRAE
jgi:predicted permease